MSLTGEREAIVVRVARFAAEATGRRVAGVEPLPPGLDVRRFFRVTWSEGRPGTAIARVEGPPRQTAAGLPPEPPLEPIRACLEASGLPVPGRYAGDSAEGIELLEDVGDESLERVAAEGPAPLRRRLYGAAVALVARLQRVAPAPGIAAFDRRLDAPLIDTKAEKWLAWALPVLLGREASAGERALTRRVFALVADAVRDAPARLAHRDYKAANLHVVGASGDERLVMIDLQGAFMAPPEYDLVCLLRDSHVMLPEEEIREHLETVRPSLPDAPAPDEFTHRFDLLTTTRVAKDVAHYLHAATERGDTRYLRYVPTAIGNLRAAAARARTTEPALGDWADWLAGLPDRAPEPTPTAPPSSRGGSACGR